MGHQTFQMGRVKPIWHDDAQKRQLFPTRALHPLTARIKSYNDEPTESEEMSFFDYYKNDELMRRTNMFACAFPSSLCETFMPFNRSIIFMPSHRIFLGRCRKASASRLLRNIRLMYESTNPRHFIVASSRIDQQYLKYYTGIDAPLLSTNAFYYTNDVWYMPFQPEIIVGPLNLNSHPLIATMNDVAKSKGGKWNFINVKGRYPNKFAMQDIANHRAVVLLPYAAHSYGITEVYAMGIPMFVPSLKFLVDLKFAGDKIIMKDFHATCYVPHQHPLGEPPQHPLSHFPYSPEDRSREAEEYWLQFSDFYDWPHITTFNSWEELIVKLDEANFGEIHEAMVKASEARNARVVTLVQDILSQVDPSERVVPQDYKTALKELWGDDVESIFVNP